MNMFKPTEAKTPEEYIQLIADDTRKQEIKKIHEFIKKNAPKLKPFIQAGMIGYGEMPYKSKSGREGTWGVLALASQKNYISIYCCAMDEGKYLAEKYSGEIGTSDIGKSCIRFKKFEEINWDELESLVKESQKIGLERGIFNGGE